ncbi:MAG: hypothetical protein JW885_16270 [Deltaproteobacteria bacterium]|nr:hypothetical protein [Candidatus Zymogenaceae bacterium]
MNLLQILLLILIAAVCGSLGMAISGFRRGGCLISVVMGFIGAMVGTYLSGLVGLPDILTIKVGGANFPVIWSIIGAVIFSLPLSLLVGGRKRK